MGLFRADGTRITKAAFPSEPATLNPEIRVTADVWQTRPYEGADVKPEGSVKTLLYKAGTIIRTNDLNKHFAGAKIDNVAPTTMGTAAGTVVTVTGEGLDGVTAGTIGGAAVTNLQILSSRQIRFTTPLQTAGVKTIILTDDSGDVTKSGAVTVA